MEPVILLNFLLLCFVTILLIVVLVRTGKAKEDIAILRRDLTDALWNIRAKKSSEEEQVSV